MKGGTLILIIVLILAAIAAWYFLIYIPSQKGTGDHSSGTVQETNNPILATQGRGNTEEAPVAPIVIESASVKILFSDITDAPPPSTNFSKFAKAIPLSVKPPRNIHYVTAGGNSKCKQYIWYKDVFYTRTNSKIDEQGYLYCYFTIGDNLLQNEIKILTSSVPMCSQDMYLSSLKYTFKETKKDILPPATYCVYSKPHG